MIVEIDDPQGFVCIDDPLFDKSVGGIRLISGVNQEETCLLAKAMSFKLHTFGLPLSGAKGGVPSDNLEDFYKFIAHPKIKNLIQGNGKHQFITGPDMGTSEEEYYKALRKAGLDEFIRPGLLSQLSREYGLPMDNIVTAWGAVVVMEELLKVDKTTDPLFNKKISLEGFGKVGTGLAKLLKNRAKIVAISTRHGSIRVDSSSEYIDSGGFKVDKLIKLQQKYGDKFIHYTKLPILPTKELFSVPTDILVPGARTETITPEIASMILQARPRLVVPVSNWPYTSKGIEILEESGITCFPDFIASAGAVIAAMVEFAGVGGQQEAMDLVRAAITHETRELLIVAKACGDSTKTIFELAKERVNENRYNLLSKKELAIPEIARLLVQNYLPNLLKN